MAWVFSSVVNVLRSASHYFVEKDPKCEQIVYVDEAPPDEEQNEQTVIPPNHSEPLPQNEPNRPFFAACLSDTAIPLLEDKPPFVFEKLSEVLDFCKKYKAHNPRWKQVESHEEALLFCSSVDFNTGTTSVAAEPACLFPSVTSQQLMALRKLIVDNDLNAVRQLVESNPRYLIGSVDNPTIMHSGCRYNAFHVIAKSNQASILSYFLKCLRSHEFFQKLYSAETKTCDRMRFLLDLYLNTPDKTRANETPLHFACSFGNYDCVKLLLEQPELDRTVKNGDGKLAQEVICQRGGTASDCQRIKQLFEDQVIIPILRDEDSQAEIGTPISAKEMHNVLSPSSIDSPSRFGKKLYASVGPVTSPRASEILSDLMKTRFSPQELKVRRSDAEKGVETVARQIAYRHGAPWSEFWEFLDQSVDLATEEGLDAFESYLNSKYRRSSIEVERSVPFINGSKPTKTDQQVWTAIQRGKKIVEKSPGRRPFLEGWLKEMQKFSNDDMRSWKTPRKIPDRRTERSDKLSTPERNETCLINLLQRFEINDTP